ncbi:MULTISPECIES: hypothetical protein [Pantoea]|jgi:hypothetical protein|uniref:Uncharacterized protein n=1 Tax=Pantoea brenneri TaxID=472694 RepID=A0A7Y6NIC7_9GAMM|nr:MULTISPECIES: hypothetical protein [Pantoea]MBZ6397556.1 hypothetical protein [Pantoea sp.]MBZ6440705.1 hypothetical protein [Pantoea sp.]NUY44189.1 hypothetical protein [Pantoea brenneri]NUY51652.1 hypothetical protein [Pantoea brenneri]NUY61946.1 hypothetical protein [Pantoea brenneri]
MKNIIKRISVFNEVASLKKNLKRSIIKLEKAVNYCGKDKKTANSFKVFKRDFNKSLKTAITLINSDLKDSEVRLKAKKGLLRIEFWSAKYDFIISERDKFLRVKEKRNESSDSAFGFGNCDSGDCGGDCGGSGD